MDIIIKEAQKDLNYTVNGKDVYKDSEGNWIAREELTQAEREAFREAESNKFENVK